MILDSDYYVTTPAKIRTKEDFDSFNKGKSSDFLLRLLKENNWNYNTVVSPFLAHSIGTEDFIGPGEFDEFSGQLYCL